MVIHLILTTFDLDKIIFSLTQKKQHILILSSWYPTKDALFVGNFVQRQAELLATEYQVAVLHTKSDSSIKTIEISETIKGNLREIIIYHPKGENLIQKFLNQKKAFHLGLQKIENITLIHGHVLLSKGLQFIQAKKRFNCPLFVTEHASYYRKEIREKRSFLDKIILKKVNKHIDKLFAVSEFLKNDLQLDFPSKKIEILPNHIATKVFSPTQFSRDTKTQFLHISTLDEQVKNPKGILDACLLLIKGGQSNFHLTIISDEPTEKWEKYASTNNLSEYISFLGPLEWFELAPHYQKSDAFILFSSYETFSIVLAEAWACGIPTITTSVGIGNQLSEKLGIQVEINSPESLANGMSEIMENKRTFDSSFISNYAQQFSAENVLSIFKKYIN